MDTWNQPLVQWLVERLDTAPEGSESEKFAAKLLFDLSPPCPGDAWERVLRIVRGQR